MAMRPQNSPPAGLSRPSPADQAKRPAKPRARPGRRPKADPIDLGVLNNHLGYFVRRFQIAIFQDFIRTLAPADIRPAQYSVLVTIGANPGRSQADLGDVLGIERARLVRLLDRLEKRGLTQRLASAADRRSHALHLTADGERFLSEVKALAAQHEARLTAKLGTERRRMLIEALRDCV
jgi:DNA-binding MarR family transcriptional regulator